jgi:uncharacterized protein
MSSAPPPIEPRTAPRSRLAEQMLHVMAKPIGPICNLDCEYCYYLHKEELYPGTTSWRMAPRTLETYIRQYIEAQPQLASGAREEITFAWQGGEPTLLGIEFFERIVALQRKYAPPGCRIANALQTNGVLLNDEWARFFKEHRFLVGLSIDGPAEMHDRYRYDKKGEGTFRSVLRALHLLQKHQVEFNALVVVHRENANHGKRVYTYLRDNGIEYLQFIPIVERRGVGEHPEPPFDPGPERDETAGGGEWDHLVSSRSVRPEQFGRFLIDVFEEWISRDVGKVFVQIFDQALAAWLGLEPSLCVFRKQCGRALAIEHNGDLYSCDHYVEPEYKLGNIHELPIIELANSERQQAFGEEKERSLPRYCRDCEVRFACNGECPKNRFITTPDGEPGLNYLCAGYRTFFNHIDPYMQQMAAELRAGRSAANVMQQFRKRPPNSRAGSEPAGSRTTKKPTADNREKHPLGGTPPMQPGPRESRPPGRNDPCPCGSGRKYKKCCGEPT